VGVRWTCQRDLLASQLRISGSLWVASISHKGASVRRQQMDDVVFRKSEADIDFIPVSAATSGAPGPEDRFWAWA
jgi:hypothetical protein